MKKVGSYEAKTNLPSLLRVAENGERVVITRSGKPVADLVPHRYTREDPVTVIAKIREMRHGITLGDNDLKGIGLASNDKALRATAKHCGVFY